jgi:MFS transporter, DHA1 family, multidrug resistance protein
LCIGIYTTCMGVGFAIGSAISGRLAEDLGFNAGFWFATAIVLASFAILVLGPARPAVLPRPARVSSSQSITTGIGRLIRQPRLLAACLGQLGIAMVNEGAMFNFFPLYAASLGLNKAAIGSLLSVRTLASASARLPTGALVGRLSSKRLMVMALTLSMVCVTLIPFAKTPGLLVLFVAGEGMAFGMFFASSNASIAEETTEANRGTATGMYTMSGSIGTTVGPLALGAAAAAWGLETVFWVTGAVLLVDLGIILSLHARTRPVVPAPAG